MRPTKPAYDIAQYRIYCDDGFLTAAACASQLAKRKRVAEHGQVLNSWGCPAIDDRIAPTVVDTLAEGSLLFFWYPDGDWSERSAYLP